MFKVGSKVYHGTEAFIILSFDGVTDGVEHYNKYTIKKDGGRKVLKVKEIDNLFYEL